MEKRWPTFPLLLKSYRVVRASISIPLRPPFPSREEFINPRRSSLFLSLCCGARSKTPITVTRQFSPSSLGPTLGATLISQPTYLRYRYGQLEKFGGNDHGDYYGLLRIKMEIDGGKMEGGIPRRVLRSGVSATLPRVLLFRTWNSRVVPSTLLFSSLNFTSVDYESVNQLLLFL